MASSSDAQRTWAIVTVGVLALIGIGWGLWSRRPPPQLETDEEVFNTVDALFTAITSHDSGRLEMCEQRLKAYHDQGRTSDAVASSLDVVIQQARKGQWEAAARRLYDFMHGQRG